MAPPNRPLFNLPPSNRGAKELVSDYLARVDQEKLAASNSWEDEQEQLSSAEKDRLESFKAFSAEDLINVVQDQSALAEWHEKHTECSQMHLERLIRMQQLTDKSIADIEASNKLLQESYAALTETTPQVPEADFEAMVQALKGVIAETPAFAPKILGELSPVFQESLQRDCAEVRRDIEDFKEKIKFEALDELTQRTMAPQNWDNLVNQIKMTYAPDAAWERQQELEQLQRDLDAANEDAVRLNAEIGQCEEQVNEKKGEVEKLESELADANSKLAVEISKREQLEKDVAGSAEQIEQERQEALVQRQAVEEFLAYLQKGSSVSAPRPQDMIPVHNIALESSTVARISSRPALPVIVVAEGHLPAAWSYLSFASQGVLMDSRFNGVITPSLDLPWVIDSLDRVIQAVLASESVPAAVLIVLLQGIAYVEEAWKILSRSIAWNAEPRQLLEALSESSLVTGRPGSVVGMVYQRVYKLVHEGRQIDSWVSPGTFEEQISARNSALPEGVVLIHQDTPGTVFLVRSTGNGELFIIDKRVMKLCSGRDYCVTMLLPSIDGLSDDLRQMELTNDEEHLEIAEWAATSS